MCTTPVLTSVSPSGPAVLAANDLFRALSAEALGEFASAMHWRIVPANTSLWSCGDPADGVYVVVSGRIRLVAPGDDGVDRVVREAGRGESVGEIGLLTRDPRSTTASAVRDTEVGWLSADAFDRLARRFPDAMMSIARTLAARLRHSVEPPRPTHSDGDRLRTLAIVPLSRDAPIDDFVSLLQLALSGRGPVRCLTECNIAERFGASAIEAEDGSETHVGISRWLASEEAEHRLLLYIAGDHASPWTTRCVRQADRILAVASTAGGPRDSSIAPALFDESSTREASDVDLVLVHEDGAMRPKATRAWRSLRPFAEHHHLRLTSRSDFERLARHLMGESVGLVLGGGGARAYAHIGVIRALEESGVAIDRIGGTSVGALIAAQYAYGRDCDEMLTINRKSWVEQRPLRGYTLPVIALLSGNGPARALECEFGQDRIEDLWLPFFCVSTNLTRATLSIHRDGPIARSVQASMSVPGILPPVVSDAGDLLVDGAVLNNVPADVMRAMTRGPVIAVDVSPDAALSFGTDIQTTPTPWQAIRRHSMARPRSERTSFPSILRVIARSTLAASSNHARRMRDEVALHLRPPLAGYDMLDWQAIERIADEGYRYAITAIAESRFGRLACDSAG